MTFQIFKRVTRLDVPCSTLKTSYQIKIIPAYKKRYRIGCSKHRRFISVEQEKVKKLRALFLVVHVLHKRINVPAIEVTIFHLGLIYIKFGVYLEYQYFRKLLNKLISFKNPVFLSRTEIGYRECDGQLVTCGMLCNLEIR